MTDPLRLSSELGIRDSEGLHKSLLDRVEEPALVTIDGSEVSRIDTAALQLLLAFIRDRQEHERETEWLGVSAALHQAAKIVGLVELLALPETGDKQ